MWERGRECALGQGACCREAAALRAGVRLRTYSFQSFPSRLHHPSLQASATVPEIAGGPRLHRGQRLVDAGKSRNRCLLLLEWLLRVRKWGWEVHRIGGCAHGGLQGTEVNRTVQLVSSFCMRVWCHQPTHSPRPLPACLHLALCSRLRAGALPVCHRRRLHPPAGAVHAAHTPHASQPGQ